MGPSGVRGVGANNAQGVIRDCDRMERLRLPIGGLAIKVMGIPRDCGRDTADAGYMPTGFYSWGWHPRVPALYQGSLQAHWKRLHFSLRRHWNAGGSR